MKKTSSIILTLVASVSITLGSAVTSQAQETSPPQNLYDTENFGGDPRHDTVRTDTVRRDTVVNNHYYTNQTYVYYDYYYRSPFWNSMFRFWFPRRYYRAINAPGFVPRHLRPARAEGLHAKSGPRSTRGTSSGRRGGFGHFGTSHSTAG